LANEGAGGERNHGRDESLAGRSAKSRGLDAARGETELSRRSLFKKTLGGALLLTAAGAVPLALRRTQLREPPAGRTLRFFTLAEYSIVAAVAERVLAESVPPELEGHAPGGAPDLPAASAADIASQPAAPAPASLDVAGRIDAFLAPSDPATARDFKQLLALFDNALFSLVSGGPARPFTQMSPAQQDEQLGRWARSRLPMLRTGYQAMKRLCAAIYFSAPETYASVGYPGPPYELVRAVNAAMAPAGAAPANPRPAQSGATSVSGAHR